MVKTEEFENPKYVGDPINAVRIFNTKEVDELIFLDITASRVNRGPNYGRIADIASECFMPFCYGGGIRSLDQAQRILSIGAEKVAINSAAFDNMDILSALSNRFGSQSVVLSMDVKRNLFGRYQVFDHRKKRAIRIDPVAYAKNAEKMGAGEILVTSVDRDGTMSGYDLTLINEVSEAVTIPVIGCGGAGVLRHFREAIDAGASAVAAGSMFVFIGKHKAVLINYPEYNAITALFAQG